MVRKGQGGDEELEPVTIKKVRNNFSLSNFLTCVKIWFLFQTPSPSDSEEWFGGIFEVDNEVQDCTER